MKTKFSKTWISSVQPRKQRKFRFNAPLSIKRKFMSINISKELREKHGIRNITPRTGDKVKVVRGSFKSKSGLIEKVDVNNMKVYVGKIELTKKDGSKSKSPIHPSNLQITELNMSDKFRKNKLTEKKGDSKKKNTVKKEKKTQSTNPSLKQEAK
jgi:large subunit ribosomal protein L24